MNRAHAYRCEEADRIVEEAIRGVGADVDALRVPRLLGVVLGGGYARGEGGVFFGRSVDRSIGRSVEGTDSPTERPNDRTAERPSDHPTVRLSNDLDFYVVAEEGTDAEGLARIAEALRPVSEKWTAALGVDVDFSPPKTPWRIRHDQERLMIQDLVNGYCDVAGKPGTELFAGVDRRPPEALPAMEAVRFLVPAEGSLISCDDMVIPVTAPEPELAHAFINAVLEPQNAADLTQEIYYLCPNAASYELLPEDFRTDPVFFPPEDVVAKLEVIDYLGAGDAKYTKIWDEIKAAD